MRIMIDTNVIVSAVYNARSNPSYALRHVCENHKLVLCDYIVAECRGVILRKFPHHVETLNQLLASLKYEYVMAPSFGLIMPDPKDSPILNAAIMANVDIIISGDKHFLSLENERPIILSPSEYLDTTKDLLLLKENDKVELKADNNSIIVTKANRKRRARISLEERFNGYSGTYVCCECDSGKPVGNEVW